MLEGVGPLLQQAHTVRARLNDRDHGHQEDPAFGVPEAVRVLRPPAWQHYGGQEGQADGGVSSLGRYVFGSEISYNKAPPRPAWASLLNSPKSQKSLGH